VARKDPGPQSKVRTISILGAVRGKHPGFIKPQLATLRSSPPTSGDYIHEIKLDGYRIQAHIRDGYASLWTRGGLDWSRKFRTITVGIGSIPATDAIIDGEIISATENGSANFSQLQDDIAKGRYDRMVYYAFDLIHLERYDLRAVPLIERKKALLDLLKRSDDIEPVRYSEHFDTDGGTLFARACELGLEGIISKQKVAPYRSERNEAWIKVKCIQVGRYEVIGYKEGATSLYLGRREGKEFLYAGKAGTGYTNKMIIEIGKLMKPMTVKKSPLTKKASHKIDYWVEPKYWAEVGYSDITAQGHLRHVTFRGLFSTRTSKTPLVSKFR
jgi:bifunctional non-homologous end joining protein LigD